MRGIYNLSKKRSSNVRFKRKNSLLDYASLMSIREFFFEAKVYFLLISLGNYNIRE